MQYRPRVLLQVVPSALGPGKVDDLSTLKASTMSRLNTRERGWVKFSFLWVHRVLLWANSKKEEDYTCP